MTSWRYIIAKEVDEWENTYYSIREYYEYTDDEPAWTVDWVQPFGESREELIITLENMLKDAKSGEVLDLTLDEPKIVTDLK